VFARVIFADIAIDRLDEAVGTARELLPATRESDGYRAFYLLTDRLAGHMMTISLWDTHDDAKAVEARAAGIRDTAVRSVGGVPPPVSVYEVEIGDQA
jgi:heme-degrading monooxygenase HmoA